MRLILHAVAAFLIATLVGIWGIPLYGLGVAGWWVWRRCQQQEAELNRLDDAYWRERAEYEISTGKGWRDG